MHTSSSLSRDTSDQKKFSGNDRGSVLTSSRRSSRSGPMSLTCSSKQYNRAWDHHNQPTPPFSPSFSSPSFSPTGFLFSLLPFLLCPHLFSLVDISYSNWSNHHTILATMTYTEHVSLTLPHVPRSPHTSQTSQFTPFTHTHTDKLAKWLTLVPPPKGPKDSDTLPECKGKFQMGFRLEHPLNL